MLGKYTFVETFKGANLVSFDVGIVGLNSRKNSPKEGEEESKEFSSD